MTAPVDVSTGNDDDKGQTRRRPRLSDAEYRSNVDAAWGRVDAIDRTEGMRAYQRYHRTMAYYADRYRVGLPGVVGAFAALSPNNDYLGNLRSLVSVLDGMRDGRTVESCTISTYHACRARAWSFLHGVDFLDVTKGPKTRAFYMNILDPTDADAVTIDGHMVSVSYGRRLTMLQAVRVGFSYATLARIFREAAVDREILPHQLQATLWFTWKRIHGVIYSSQLDCFRGDDQWASGLDPATVRPYGPKKSGRVVVAVPGHVDRAALTLPFGS